MQNKLVTTVIWFVALAIVIAITLAIVGGGFGPKPPLPEVLQSANRPVLIAHRGSTVNAPENTLQAFTEAQARGYRWVELDIQYSADSKFVVFHDRLGGEALPSVDVVSELSVEQLQAHKIVAEGKATSHSAPTLESVVKTLDSNVMYYLDMKKHGHSSVFALADDIAEFIVQHDLQSNAFVASHRVALICYLEFAHPEINTALEGYNHELASALDYIPTNFKPDLVAGYQAVLNEELVAELRESNWMQRYIAFHVDSANLKQTLDWGIQYIMLDDGDYVDSLLELQSAN